MNLFCKDCKRMFVFSEREQAFFAQHKWSEPVRCRDCRKIYRERQKDPSFGWKSTMHVSFGWKHRRHRVAYPPHTVGGFR